MTENLVNFDVATHDSDKIKELITKIKSDFIYLGLLLKEFKEAEEYKNLNYASFESYVENELHFNKSTAYNLIAVQERFGDGMNINKKYVDYSYSQLTELVKYSDVELNNFYPASLSVRAIKNKKASEREAFKRVSKRLENATADKTKYRLIGEVKYHVDLPDDFIVAFNTLLNSLDSLQKSVNADYCISLSKIC